MCPSPIGMETVHSSFLSRFISAWVLIPSDDIRDQPVLVFLFSTDRAGGAPIFFSGTLCVPVPQWSFSLYLFRVRPTLNLQINWLHLRCQFHFHVRCCPLHDLLRCVLLYLVHLFLHVLFHELSCRHGLNGQQHKYYSFWSSLMKGWKMDRVLQPL